MLSKPVFASIENESYQKIGETLDNFFNFLAEYEKDYMFKIVAVKPTHAGPASDEISVSIGKKTLKFNNGLIGNWKFYNSLFNCLIFSQ